MIKILFGLYYEKVDYLLECRFLCGRMEEREEAEWVGRERRGMDFLKEAERSFGVDGYQA